MKNKKVFLAGAMLIITAAAIIGLTHGSYAAEATGGAAGNQINKVRHLARTNPNVKTNSKTNLNKNKTGNSQRQQSLQAIQAAIAANDYAAWVKAVGADSAMAKKITADNFPQLVQAYQLRQQADNILKTLGIGIGMAGYSPAK